MFGEKSPAIGVDHSDLQQGQCDRCSSCETLGDESLLGNGGTDRR